MKHLFFIDHLSKLSIKKDSSLMLALAFKKRKIVTRVIFEEDLYWSNIDQTLVLNVFDFDGQFDSNNCYLKDFRLGRKEKIQLEQGDTLHMRLDPPFDSKYLRFLWILKSIRKLGVKIINDPEGILCYNEKLFAYEQKDSLETFIGQDATHLDSFLENLKRKNINEVVLKPLDMYQGIGVEKVSIEHAKETFNKKVKQLKGPAILQPFYERVSEGEVRSIYFKGEEIGNILKRPKPGEFLANIAQGASYQKIDLNQTQKKVCDRIASELLKHNVYWIAFDILGDMVSEVNITCPGLLVEVSSAYQTNLADRIIDLL